MIEYTSGDIIHADTEAIVNAVNCVGVMGRGLALQFRRAYPANYKYYRWICERRRLRLGKVLTFDRGEGEKPRYIINFPTKFHWKDNSRLESLEPGLDALLSEARRLQLGSIAIPPLGCGLGGLDWMDVKPRIVSVFEELTWVRVVLYETF